MTRSLAVYLGCALGLSAFASGCSSSGRYLVEPSVLAQLGMRPTGGRLAVVPAVRASDHKAVWVKASALQLDATQLAPAVDSGPITVEARGVNRMVVAGSVLTWIGTAISIAGTVMLAASSDLRLAGAITALSAEPIMWTGTGLWIAGLSRPPYEVAPKRGQYDYLGEGRLPEGALAKPRIASLRFSF